MLSTAPRSDDELVDRKWREIIKSDEFLARAIANEKINTKVLFRGRARDSMKIKWAEALRKNLKIVQKAN